ncbi:MAG TPA: BON domain-containing protein, partial [Gemmatimonadaceae bacterium]
MLAEIGKATEAIPTLSTSSLRDDDRIIEAAIRALKSEYIVPGSRFTIDVERGWLTLSGFAAHPVERSAAECVVRCVPGVVGVTNRLVIAH